FFELHNVSPPQNISLKSHQSDYKQYVSKSPPFVTNLPIFLPMPPIWALLRRCPDLAAEQKCLYQRKKHLPNPAKSG
ncbi:MAG: hypothetical protein K2O34_06835, partial [Acetatifactor sp.]|nr:hypothetical protein [Acetatifactor sp.]